MEELLPRAILWADKKKMKEFLSEPLNKKIYDVYLNIKREGVIKDYETLKLFNEVYYQCSRIVNCETQQINLNDIISDIKANLGWHFSSSLVVNMIYAVLALRRNNSITVIHIINSIKEHYKLDTCATPFSKMVKDCAEKDEWYTIEFPIDKKALTLSSVDSGYKSIERAVIILKQQLLSTKEYTKAPINLTVNINNEISKVGNFIMDNHGTINDK